VTALACVTGRFQPVHRQHLELFEIALRDADHVVVAVTNPDPGARHEESTSQHRHRASANPFTYFERAWLLAVALAEHGLTGRSTVVPFDLTRPDHWHEYVPPVARQVVRAYSDWERHKAQLLADGGYEVQLLHGDPVGQISASEIRRRFAAGEAWEELVPTATVPLLRELLPAHGSLR
jgi:cytidyltransferase-like protein